MMMCAPPAADSIRRHRDGLQAGRAEAIDRHSGDDIGQARAQRGDSGHVHAGFGFGHGAAENHVLDFFLGDARVAFE